MIKPCCTCSTLGMGMGGRVGVEEEGEHVNTTFDFKLLFTFYFLNLFFFSLFFLNYYKFFCLFSHLLCETAWDD